MSTIRENMATVKEMVVVNPLRTDNWLMESIGDAVGAAYLDSALEKVTRLPEGEAGSWPMTVVLPGRVESVAWSDVRPDSRPFVFDCKDYADYEDGFPTGVSGWGIQNIYLSRVSEKEQWYRSGASLMLVATLDNGDPKQGVFYRVLLSLFGGSSCRALGVEYCVVGAEECDRLIWCQAGASEARRFLKVLEGIKRLMATTPKSE